MLYDYTRKKILASVSEIKKGKLGVASYFGKNPFIIVPNYF